MGSTVPAGSGADGNFDGAINQLDLAIWKANYGNYTDDHSNVSVGATAVAAPGDDRRQDRGAGRTSIGSRLTSRC